MRIMTLNHGVSPCDAGRGEDRLFELMLQHELQSVFVVRSMGRADSPQQTQVCAALVCLSSARIKTSTNVCVLTSGSGTFKKRR